jgi:predicted transcriptional regulator
MSTTTIRLPEALKVRVERLAAARGSTAHAFMVEVIAEAADQQERRQAFEAEAERRLKEMARTGEYLTLDDLRAYGAALARGEKPVSPKPRRMTPQEQARMRASLRRMG